jgi:hypothetical protein
MRGYPILTLNPPAVWPAFVDWVTFTTIRRPRACGSQYQGDRVGILVQSESTTLCRRGRPMNADAARTLFVPTADSRPLTAAVFEVFCG